MSGRVAVIFVHGIMAAGPDYSAAMEKKLIERLKGQARNVKFFPVYWANAVRRRQRDFLKNVCDREKIVNNRLRRFFLEGMGDAAAYQKTHDRKNSIYYMVHEEIAKAFQEFSAPAWRDAPLIFIGHSLGCHIISSYVWDTNRLKQMTEANISARNDEGLKKLWDSLQAASPIRRLDTLAGLVTLGSNMPLFTFTFGPDRVFPVTCVSEEHASLKLKPAFPGVALTSPIAERACWLNFFSRRDVLGFPLKTLNDYYGKDDRIRDIRVRSEAWYTRLLPYWSFVSAHNGYWTNKTVLDQTAQLITEIMSSPQPERSADTIAASSELKREPA
jgi:hypothetical protein